MPDVYEPHRLWDGDRVTETAVDDSSWSCADRARDDSVRDWSPKRRPSLQIGAADIERPRRTPDELFGDDANPEPAWDRLGSWL